MDMDLEKHILPSTHAFFETARIGRGCYFFVAEFCAFSIPPVGLYFKHACLNYQAWTNCPWQVWMQGLHQAHTSSGMPQNCCRWKAGTKNSSSSFIVLTMSPCNRKHNLLMFIKPEPMKQQADREEARICYSHKENREVTSYSDVKEHWPHHLSHSEKVQSCFPRAAVKFEHTETQRE